MCAPDFPFPFTDVDAAHIGDCDSVLTLVNLRMIELSYALRGKPLWWTKIHDPTIRSKWKAEALEHEIRGDKLKEAEVEWVLEELEDYAKMRDETTGIQPSCHIRIWESDELVSQDLYSRLRSAVSVFENVPEEEKDWHPRSNNQVLDLVHPSLFCAVYGRTQFWDTSNGGRELKLLDTPDGENGSPARALGYINNVHPQKHKDLITAIEYLVGRFSLLWDKVLTDIHSKHDFRDLGRAKVSGSYEWIYNPDYPLPRWEEFEQLGSKENGSSNQPVGAVKTFVNRCIAFPNTYQHQVSSFKLVDPTKPGHRKIVALFLVDPEDRLPSTSDIPPQQSDWTREAIFEALVRGNHRMKAPLPVELVDMVADRVDNVMTLEEAKAYRLELMDERAAFVDVVDEQHFCTTFNFCEH
ncbi:hypothetical protein M407DRAFT_26303 [Tulasnella calospora MUT 4182]|uniref:Uncharacterized protein n=1 Tax=Tulasnella calospora MUT 4182 TaxID=1051891 RepID=A0A0C3LSB4_9AGAM|nr:hypothetical protein M407DRAFT_26303 [Tulasnella calospora MUT 4182]